VTRPRAVLVTGGGSGIGAAVARMLTAAGSRVAVCGRRADALRAVAAETGALGLVCDVADAGQVARVVETVAGEFGGLDGLVLNAGVIAPGGVADLSPADWSAMVSVNLTGAFLVARSALPHLLRARGAVGGRKSGIDGRPELGGERGGLDAGECGVEMGLKSGLGLVDEFADDGLLLLGHGAHLLHEGGELAVGADETGLGGFKVGARGDGRKFGGGFGEKGGKLVLHGKEESEANGPEWKNKKDGASKMRPVLREGGPSVRTGRALGASRAGSRYQELGFRGSGGLGLQRGFHLGDDAGKGDFVTDREIRQNLAVHLDVRGVEAFDETAVADVLGAAGGVQTDDPETTAVGLLLLAGGVSILPGVLDSVFGVAEELRLVAEIATSVFQRFLMTLAGSG